MIYSYSTSLSSGNQVDDLPLALHTEAVSASWRNRGRATIGDFAHKFYMIAYINNIKVLVNFYLDVKLDKMMLRNNINDVNLYW